MKKYQGQTMKGRNMSQEIGEEYASSLSDLTVNSKPLINMLTILAEENILYAPVIVQAVQKHLSKVNSNIKLPVLYLVDSIIKNVGGSYKELFTHCIIEMFCSVFASVDERIRTQMYKLRQTWIDIFPSALLYSLDVKVNGIDCAWPIAAHAGKCNSIHVNPNFLKKTEEGSIRRNSNAVEFIAKASDNSDIRSQIISKQRELLQLEKKKLELQLEATKRKLDEQQLELKSKEFANLKGLAIPTLEEAASHVNNNKIKQENKPKVRTSRDPRLNRMHDEAERNRSTTTSTSCLNQKEITDLKRPVAHHISVSQNLKNKSIIEEPGSTDISELINLGFDADKSKTNDLQSLSERGASKDVDLRILVPQPLKNFRTFNSPQRKASRTIDHLLSEIDPKPQNIITRKHSFEDEKLESRKKSKLDTLGDLFGAEDVDQRKLSAGRKNVAIDQENSMDTSNFASKNLSQSQVTKIWETDMIISPNENKSSICNLEVVRAKLAEATKNTNFDNEHALSSNLFNQIVQGGTNETQNVSKPGMLAEPNYFKTSPVTPFTSALNNLSPISDDDFHTEQVNFKLRKTQTMLSNIKHEFSSNGRSGRCRKRSREIVDVSNLGKYEVKIVAPSSLIESLQKIDTQSSDEFWQRHEERNRKEGSQSEAPCLGIVPLTEPWRSVTSFKQTNTYETDNLRNLLDDKFLQEIQTFESMKPVELPLANPLIIDFINKDLVRIIHIDGIPRDIRFYNDTAVTLMNWREAHEIRFYDGERRITFDGIRSYILRLNHSYLNVLIHGVEHKIKLGSPTRELYIDGIWYECFFGGPPITIQLHGRPTMVQLDGPIPQVKMGVNRNDLVAGKVNVMVDALVTCTLYLDPKPQKVELSDCVLVFRFADALQTVYINEVPFDTDFGGGPKHFIVQNNRHFVRFSELPEHVKPGYIHIKNMPNAKIQNVTFPVNFYNSKAPSYKTHPTASFNNNNYKETRHPHPVREFTKGNTTKSVEEILELLTRKSPDLKHSTKTEVTNGLETGMDLGGIFKKVTGTNIFAEGREMNTSFPYIDREDDFPNFNRPETLSIRNDVLIDKMHAGIQCATCGLRFTPEHSLKYSQHLDWHFRQNKYELSKKSKENRWNCSLLEWIQYDESAIATKRGSDSNEDDDLVISTNVIPTLPAEKNSSNTCNGCQEKFDQFYNEDKEQWELRNAIKLEGLLYHPICFSGENSSGLYGSENEMFNLKIKLEIEEEWEDVSESRSLCESNDINDYRSKPNGGILDDDDVTIQEPFIEVVNIQDDDIVQNMAALKNTDGTIIIKEEPMDFDDDEDDSINVIINAKPADNTRTTVISTIDGNDQLEPADHERITNLNKIVVNLTNSVPVAQSKNPEYKVKESLKGVVFDVQDPMNIGTEISGFCSIM